jgi:hypothetical protein
MKRPKSQKFQTTSKKYIRTYVFPASEKSLKNTPFGDCKRNDKSWLFLWKIRQVL